jgi:hypothetical protein
MRRIEFLGSGAKVRDTAEIKKVKKNLVKLPPEKIAELSDFVEFLLMKANRSQDRKIKKLGGIWEGLGFDRLDIEKEISEIRSGIETSVFENG